MSDPVAVTSVLTQLRFDDGPEGTRTMALGVILAFAIIYLLSAWWSARHKQELRKLPAFARAEQMVDEAAESGGWLHLSAGTAPLGGQSTAETLAGLGALRALIQMAQTRRARVIVTTSDPLTLVAAKGMVEEVRRASGDRAPQARVEFIAPEPIAYAAGVMGILDRGKPMGNIMLGSFGDEYLLMGHVGAEQRLPQVVGSSSVTTLPFVVTSADHPVLGEEIFAAGAYLSRDPGQRAVLVARDWGRTLVIASILGLALLRTAGVL